MPRHYSQKQELFKTIFTNNTKMPESSGSVEIGQHDDEFKGWIESKLTNNQIIKDLSDIDLMNYFRRFMTWRVRDTETRDLSETIIFKEVPELSVETELTKRQIATLSRLRKNLCK
jgi:hypothetical protein